MIRVYVSSSFSDLVDCRKRVSLELKKMRQYEDIAMEYYIAEAKRPLDKCLEDVAASDLYICLIAWRYGSRPDGSDLSYTELEYRHATNLGKPTLVFLLDDQAPWPRSHVERGAEDEVEAFRELAGKQLAGKFTGPEDLATALIQSMRRWEIDQGIASGSQSDWGEYRAAIAEKHRWVRLAVIAGASQDRRAGQIPLSDIFVSQRAVAGRPDYDLPVDKRDSGVPEEPEEADHTPEEASDHEMSDDDFATGSEPVSENVALPIGTALLRAAVQESSVLVLGREPKQVFLGGPGSGKSTLFHFAMLAVCDPTVDEEAIPPGLRERPCPFLVELRQYTLRKASGFVDYLVDNARDFYGVEIETMGVRHLLAQPGGAIVLFDGLDEILNSAERARVIEQFDAFARQYPNTTIVVSSRIAGYDPERLQLARFAHYTLLDFGLTEIREFVPRWYRYYTWQGDERHATGLLARISESPRLFDLSGNPLLLTMMAVIYKHQDLPERRWQLYERCTQVLLEDWDVKRKKFERDELLDFKMLSEQKAKILTNVAMQMLLAHQPGRQLNAIQRDVLLGIMAKYIQGEFRKVPPEARAIADEILNHIHERTFILAEIGENTFGFVHRTFMEFFAAQKQQAEFNRRKADYRWLRDEVFLPRWKRDEWREVLFLLLGMIKHQEYPIDEIVEVLLRQPTQAGQPERHVEFAARCLAEAGATDGPLAQEVLEQLTRSILRWARETQRAEIDRYVTDALVAFSMLVTTIPLPDSLRAMVATAKTKKRRDHMVVWQMQLALRSKEDRLPFAVQALEDREEAVRLGAIATMEREWPGRERLGEALLKVASSDRNSRVREAVVQALRRSWPDQPGILEMLSERAADESAFSHVLWLADYVATSWKAHPLALTVLLRLAAKKRRATAQYDYRAVASGVSQAIVRAWAGSPDVAAKLQAAFTDSDPAVQGVILLSLARWGTEDAHLLNWVDGHLGTVPKMQREGVLEAIAERMAGSADGLAWLQKRAITGPDDTRVEAILGIARGWSNRPDVLDWTVAQISVDQPTAVCRATLAAIAMNAPPDKAAAILLEIAQRNESAEIRAQAVHILARDFTYADIASLLNPNTAKSRPTIAAFELLLTSDPEPSVRQAAAFALGRASTFTFDVNPALLRAFRFDESQIVRATALSVIAVRFAATPKSPIQSGQFSIRIRHALGQLGQDLGSFVNDLWSEIRPIHWRWAQPLDEATETALREAASEDTVPGIRMAAELLLSESRKAANQPVH